MGDHVDLLEGVQRITSGMEYVQQANYVLMVHVL